MSTSPVTSNEPEPTLQVSEVIEQFDVTERTVRKRIATNELDVVRVGRRVLVTYESAQRLFCPAGQPAPRQPPWLVIFYGNAVTPEHAQAVRDDVADAPPLSSEQIDLLRVLIRPREPGTVQVLSFPGDDEGSQR
jgi:hypothetical protein